MFQAGQSHCKEVDEAARDVRAAASQRIQQTEEAAAEKVARIKARLAEAKERVSELEATNREERETAAANVRRLLLEGLLLCRWI